MFKRLWLESVFEMNRMKTEKYRIYKVIIPNLLHGYPYLMNPFITIRIADSYLTKICKKSRYYLNKNYTQIMLKI